MFDVAMAAGIASGVWQLDNISPPTSDRSFDPVMAVEGWHGILSSNRPCIIRHYLTLGRCCEEMQCNIWSIVTLFLTMYI